MQELQSSSLSLKPANNHQKALSSCPQANHEAAPSVELVLEPKFPAKEMPQFLDSALNSSHNPVSPNLQPKISNTSVSCSMLFIALSIFSSLPRLGKNGGGGEPEGS